jgi:DNA-binding LacI/PurR family transcriptional regulator
MRTTVRVESDTHPLGLDEIDMHLLTRSDDRATAVVGWNDITAIRICHVLNQKGLRIPEDVAVVGFDCFEQFIIPKFWLTSIRAPWSEVGKLAVESLIRLINNKSVPFVQTIPVSLRHGDTT